MDKVTWYYCPQCMDLESEIEVEAYSCRKCGNTFCAHFMKRIGQDAVCWVCGSEKKPCGSNATTSGTA